MTWLESIITITDSRIAELKMLFASTEYYYLSYRRDIKGLIETNIEWNETAKRKITFLRSMR